MVALIRLGLFLFLAYHLFGIIYVVGYIVVDIIQSIYKAYKRGDFDDIY